MRLFLRVVSFFLSLSVFPRLSTSSKQSTSQHVLLAWAGPPERAEDCADLGLFRRISRVVACDVRRGEERWQSCSHAAGTAPFRLGADDGDCRTCHVSDTAGFS